MPVRSALVLGNLMPADPEQILSEARKEAKHHKHVTECFVTTYACPIDRLAQVARIVGRLEQHTEGPCMECDQECIVCAAGDACPERDCLLAELEKVSK